MFCWQVGLAQQPTNYYHVAHWNVLYVLLARQPTKISLALTSVLLDNRQKYYSVALPEYSFYACRRCGWRSEVSLAKIKPTSWILRATPSGWTAVDESDSAQLRAVGRQSTNLKLLRRGGSRKKVDLPLGGRRERTDYLSNLRPARFQVSRGARENTRHRKSSHFVDNFWLLVSRNTSKSSHFLVELLASRVNASKSSRFLVEVMASHLLYCSHLSVF